MKLTQKRLRELLHYNPETGVFTWLETGGGRSIDRCAGGINNGYRKIKINYISYLAHRLAFPYVNGYFPENDVDHINRIRDDNRWCNLREASKSCNARNSGVGRNNKSGVIGVGWGNDRYVWKASISVDGRNKFLGRFKNIQDAVKARWEAEVKYDWPNCNSTSTAYIYLKEHGII